MQRIFVYGLAMGCLGTSAMLVHRDAPFRSSQTLDVQLADDAAYRDGLYLGRLDRAANQEMHPPIGRWSTQKDRASFAAGYRQAFGDQQSRK